MPTLRRILKYSPAVVLGMLVVSWVASAFVWWWLTLSSATTTYFAGVHRGSLLAGYMQPVSQTPLLVSGGHETWRMSLGKFLLEDSPTPVATAYFHARVPIAVVLAVLLPLAVGPFLSFRFRLWHYLACTALVALELAYYLQWQE